MNKLGFSSKQRVAISWWMPRSPYHCYEAIICDGAVRSGKTLSMGLGFFLWAMASFEGRQFAICGKSVVSVRRNVLSHLLPLLKELGMGYQEKRAEGYVLVRWNRRENRFYLFGGYDEGSQDLIQGATFAGVLLDEAALMPRSFVEQACARCSVAGSRIWFNCNPAGPGHWFYQNWIQKAKEKNCLYLHFLMEDNPSLSAAIRKRYERLYVGAFYRRYVLGQWVAAEGRVYDFFTQDMARPAPPGPYDRWYISCDYGTVNPASFGLWGEQGGVWYRVKEYYFDSRARQFQRTDREYAQELRNLAGDRPISAVVVDPSAASFITLLRQEGWQVLKAENDVLGGIRRTSDLLKEGKLVICQECTDCLRELEDYVWDLSCGEKDRVVKQNDHAMDDMRYFVSTILAREDEPFAATTALRRGS